MGLKKSVQPDHIPVNNYKLAIPGMKDILFTQISGIEEELDTTNLPDRTTASGGNTQPVEFTAMQMAHHTEEVAAMELWFKQSQEPVVPGYKRNGTLTLKSLTNLKRRVWGPRGIFPTKRKLPDLDMNNEGEAAQIEWTFRGDSCPWIR